MEIWKLHTSVYELHKTIFSNCFTLKDIFWQNLSDVSCINNLLQCFFPHFFSPCEGFFATYFLHVKGLVYPHGGHFGLPPSHCKNFSGRPCIQYRVVFRIKWFPETIMYSYFDCYYFNWLADLLLWTDVAATWGMNKDHYYYWSQHFCCFLNMLLVPSLTNITKKICPLLSKSLYLFSDMKISFNVFSPSSPFESWQNEKFCWLV